MDRLIGAFSLLASYVQLGSRVPRAKDHGYDHDGGGADVNVMKELITR